MDFEILEQKYGAEVDAKQFQIEIPADAKVRDDEKPAAEPPPLRRLARSGDGGRRGESADSPGHRSTSAVALCGSRRGYDGRPGVARSSKAPPAT